MKAKSVWVWGCILALVVTLLPAGKVKAQEKAPTIWRMHAYMEGGQSYTARGLRHFAEGVAKHTGGRLKIEIYFSSALGYKSSEMLSCVRDGLVDIADVSIPMSEGEEPALGLSDLPQLYANYAEFYTVKDKVVRPFYNKALEKKWNQSMIWHYNFAWMNIFARKSIAKPEDFKGLKIRAVGKRDVQGFTGLGATPVALTTAEIYPSLQRGLVDAITTSCSSATELHLWEVASYMNIVRWYIVTSMITVNKDRFNKIPKDLQDAVFLAGREADEHMVKLVAGLENELYPVLEKNGMKYVYPTDALKKQLVDVARPLWDSWAKGAGPDGIEALANVKKSLGK